MNVENQKTLIDNKLQYTRIKNIALWLLYAMFFILLIRRLFFGVDISDEAFYAELANRMLQGNKLFFDMWEPVQTGALYIYPALALYAKITGGIEGIQLFLRLLYFVYACIGSIPVFIIGKKLFDKHIAIMCAICFVCYAPVQIYSVSYNTLIDSALVSATSCLAYVVVFCQTKERHLILFIVGIIMVLGAFAYPTFIITCILLALFIFILFSVQENVKKGIVAIMFYIVGSMLASILLLSIIILNIGIENFICGLKGILGDPSYGPASIVEMVSRVVTNIKSLITMFFISLHLWVLIPVIGIIFFLKKKHQEYVMLVALVPLIIFCVIYHDCRSLYPHHLNLMFVTANMLFTPFIACLANNKKKVVKLAIVYFSVALFAYINISFSSAGDYLQVSHVMIVGYIGFIIVMCFVLNEFCGDFISNYFYPKLRTIIIPIVLCMVIMIELVLFYTGVYRDENIDNLTAKIDKGPFKWLYTTQENKENIEYLYDVLQRYEEKDKTILIMYKAICPAYLSLEMKPCTPTTWGANAPPYRNNEKLFIDYYANINCLPDKIIIIDNDYLYTTEKWEANYQRIAGLYYSEMYKQIAIIESKGKNTIRIYDKE